jgi:hypothetical protein
MMRNGPVAGGGAKDEPYPKIGFWCVLFISESGSANLFANGCNSDNYPFTSGTRQEGKNKESKSMIVTGTYNPMRLSKR